MENVNSEHREFVVDQMNEQILTIGILTWDIGQGDDNSWFLTLSPNGNEEMLLVSNKIMDEAPQHLNWQFNACKPAKNWNRKFTVYDSYMDEQYIDASEWQYVVFEAKDGKLELVIEANNIPQTDTELAETAAEQFVIREIGEKPVSC